MRKIKDLMTHVPEKLRWKLLTAKQKEVLLLIAKGYGVREIAEKKKVAESVIQAHKIKAFEWLMLTCNADATCYALKYSLINETRGVNFNGHKDE